MHSIPENESRNEILTHIYKLLVANIYIQWIIDERNPVYGSKSKDYCVIIFLRVVTLIFWLFLGVTSAFLMSKVTMLRIFGTTY